MNISTFPITQFVDNTLDLLKIKFSPRFMSYSPHYHINIKTKDYRLKTATSTSELAEVFRLRHQIFLKDNAQNINTLDYDNFDSICDHLIIKCNKSNEIIGTYRVLCSLFTSTFYSQNEFNLDNFIGNDHVKLELGRACIEPAHRNGNVIHLLWKGIAKYAKLTQARFLFGCSSVSTIKPQVAFEITNYLKKKEKFSNEYNISPTNKYFVDFSNCIEESIFDSKGLIPSLLLSYLSAGAFVHGDPAYDKEFQCFDYFTILDLKKVNRLFFKRYFS